MSHLVTSYLSKRPLKLLRYLNVLLRKFYTKLKFKTKQYFCPNSIKLANKVRILQYALDSTTQKFTKLSTHLLNDKINIHSPIQGISVTDHAIHRYKERCGAKGTTDELRKQLYSKLIKLFATFDELPDGKYVLDKGVEGQIINNTLVTVLPKRKRGSPRLK